MAGSNQSLPYAGTIFAEGYVYFTGPGGAADGIPFGIITDVTFDNKWEKAKMAGPGSKLPVAVAYKSRVVSLKAKAMTFTAESMYAATGGTLAYTAPNTTQSSYQNDIPPKIQVTLKSPLDGSDISIHFGFCLADGDSWSAKLHEWAENDFECEAYGDPNSNPVGLVYVITYPGNQTAS